jgi:uncharacterized protein YbjT (DUF2867 family)
MNVFLTGGTGYIGSGLIPLLASRGHQAKALVRPGSEKKLPPGALGIPGDALRIDSYTNDVRGSDTFVHLIGTPHPSPAKAQQFRDVDLVSVRVAIRSASEAGIRQFVYLSVAQPAPVMKGFIGRTQRGRGDDSRKWHQRHFCAAVVRTRPRTSMALRDPADVLDSAAAAEH